MRIEKPTVFTPSPPARALDRACVVPICAGLSALVFDTGPGAAPRAGRIGGRIGGGGFPNRAISTRLALRRGGWRHALLVEQAAARLAETPSLLTIAGAPVAAIDPTWLQSPLADPSALIDGLTDAGRDRLLRMLSTTGASLFGTTGADGLGRAICDLARALGLPESRAASQVALGGETALLSFRLPAGASAPALDGLVAVSGERVARVAVTATIEPHAEGALLHMIVPRAVARRVFLTVGARPMTLDASTATPRPMEAWFARRSSAARAWALGALERLAASDDAAAALLRELRHRDAPPPVLTVRHLSAAPGGLLLFAELRDPNRLVASVRIEGGGVSAAIAAPSGGTAETRAILVAGLVPTIERAAPARRRIGLVYASGRVQPAGIWPVAAFGGAAPAGFARLGPARASAELAAARLSRRRPCAPVDVETIGAPVARPTLAIVAPAGLDPDVLRARAALLFAEDGASRVETLYHAGTGEAEALSRLLRETHDVFGLAARLFVFDDAVDPAARLRAALASVRAPAALALGASVLPGRPGWLGVWRAALGARRGPAIRGGALLAADGSVLDAGGDLVLRGASGAATIARRGAGLPAALLPQADALPTGVVSADCVGLSRRAIAALDRLEGHYPDADALLLALAHQFRRGRAASVTMLDAPFVRFGAQASRDPLDEAALGQAVAALTRATGEETAR